MKQAANFRVRELVKKIESHPHRQDLQAELQQRSAYNPFSEKSKKMIRDMGNVEVFEFCETIPKVQCSERLFFWNQGIVLVHLWTSLERENESSRHLHKWRLDVLSIPNYVFMKERPHGARHIKTEAQKEHIIARNARKKMCQKKLLKEFTIAFRKTSYTVIRNSEFVGLKRSASRWTSWRRKMSPIAHQLRSLR